MRVLFVATWPTHWQPMVPLAWALNAQGHQVRVAVPPRHTDVVVRSGQIAVPAGSEDVDIAEIHKREVLPLMGSVAEESKGAVTELRIRRTRASIGIYEKVAKAMAHDTMAFAEKWRPDLVVYEPTAFVGPLVGEVLGVPAARHLWGPDGTSAGPGRGGRLESTALDELARGFGVPTFDNRGDLTIDPCPASLQPPLDCKRLPMRYVPYNGSMARPPAPLPAPARPRICVSWGVSTFALAGGDSFLVPQVLEALRGLPIEIVVAAREEHHDLVAAPGVEARVVEMELRLLLPTCDALIHQGGGGTLLTAAACGIPQLVIPQMPDQRFSARQLASAGAARVIPADEFDVEAVRKQAQALLDDDDLKAGAERLRDENSSRPSPAEVVSELEKIIG